MKPEQLAQCISDDFMLDLDGRVALAHAIKNALAAYADAKLEEAAYIAVLKKKELNGIYDDPFIEGKYAMADTLEREIRALKSPTPEEKR